ncbi:methyltransferase [Candidatus Micrarchaeota archaeon]|nr:methyltransferase [Candidatus Micrarchaeota archaeon]
MNKIKLNAENLLEIKDALSRLYKHKNSTFSKLFLLEGETELEKNIALPLLKANLIKPGSGSNFISNVRIWKSKKKFIITDLFTCARKDRVYPIFADESDFLVNNLIVDKNDEVLDVCTGSGIQAICCAEKSGKVIAVDVNKRALSFAGFNTKLNNLEGQIELIHSDLFAKIPKKKFDLIVSNPPFIPVPNEKNWFLHGSAGYDGLKIVKRILKESKKYLKPKGKLQIITHSFGAAKKIQVLNLVKKHFPKSRIQLVHLMNPKKIKAKKYLTRFSGSANFGSWKKFLKKNNLNYMYRVLINIFPAKKFSLEEVQNKKFRFTMNESFNQKPFKVRPYYSGGWKEMIQRYGDVSLFLGGE